MYSSYVISSVIPTEIKFLFSLFESTPFSFNTWDRFSVNVIFLDVSRKLLANNIPRLFLHYASRMPSRSSLDAFQASFFCLARFCLVHFAEFLIQFPDLDVMWRSKSTCTVPADAL